MSGTSTRVRPPPPGTYTVDPNRCSITFTTRRKFGLGGVRGSFTIRNAEIMVEEPVSRSTVTVEVDAGSFDTGSSSRDEKVRSASFMGVRDHPTIAFVSSSITRHGETWTLSGVLTVHGRPAPLDLTVESAAVADGVLTLQATGTVDWCAHGITSLKGMAGRRLTMAVAAHVTTTTDVPSVTDRTPEPQHRYPRGSPHVRAHQDLHHLLLLHRHGARPGLLDRGGCACGRR